MINWIKKRIARSPQSTAATREQTHDSDANVSGWYIISVGPNESEQYLAGYRIDGGQLTVTTLEGSLSEAICGTPTDLSQIEEQAVELMAELIASGEARCVADDTREAANQLLALINLLTEDGKLGGVVYRDEEQRKLPFPISLTTH